MVSTDVFAALGNPIRRALLTKLRNGPLTVNALASGFDRGRPAISEHLRVLKDAGLVREQARGRERHYRLEAAPLREAFDWLSGYEKFWNERTDALGRLLDEEP